MKDLQTANRETAHNDERTQPPEPPYQEPAKVRRKLISNPEILAMQGIDDIMSNLSEPQIDRVLSWVNAVWAPAKPLPPGTPDARD